MNKLNRFYLSQNISIDNALSMNQILHQIVNQIKEIVEFINNLELRANEYTDQEILKLKNDLENQLATLEQTLKTYTNDSIDTYNVEVINPQLQTIRNTIDTLNRTLNDRITNEVGILNRRINSEVSTINRIIEDTKIYLEDLIKKGMAYVYSSISGRHLPLQDVLGEIGNVLKQILSYNCNNIDEFKTFNYTSYDFYETLNTYQTTFGTTKFTKGILKSSIPVVDNHQYVYFKLNDNVESYYNNMSIGSTWMGSFGMGDSVDNIVGASGPFTYEKIADDVFRVDLTGTNIGTYDYVFIGIDFTLTAQERVNIAEDLSKVDCYGGAEITVNTKITFNSLKLAMQELNVNWNSLIYTGVNTFYELNETEKLFDTEGVKSDYFTGNKYKVIHNNFDSDFFAYEEEENNENEGE